MKHKEILYMTALALGLSAATAPAAVIMTAQEIGDDVVFTAVGTYDVTSLTLLSNTATFRGRTSPRIGSVVFGNNDWGNVDTYTGFTLSPTVLGTGSGGRATAGAPALRFGFSFSTGESRILVPRGTTTGTLDETMTFESQNFASLGLTEGVYDWAWQADSARLTIGNDVSVAPVPLPASLPLILVGFGAFMELRRRARATPDCKGMTNRLDDSLSEGP